MATMAISGNPLDTPFFSHEPIPSDVRQSFVNALWPRQDENNGEEGINDFGSYFSNLQQERHPDLASQHVVRTLDDIISIIRIILKNPSASFSEIRATMQRKNPEWTATSISHSIELAVRLWLRVNVRNLMPTDRRQLETAISWPDTISLKATLERLFKPQLSVLTRRFPEHFNVADMSKMAGFKVEWTDCLTSHLILDGSVIHMFNNVSILRRMREFSKW
jgi:hypothetical protein